MHSFHTLAEQFFNVACAAYEYDSFSSWKDDLVSVLQSFAPATKRTHSPREGFAGQFCL
jgi:hypothetical protein